MKKLLTVVVFLFGSMLCAQTITTLYGLSYGQNSNGLFLASLDPATGLVTEISPAPIASTVVSCYSTIDPVNNIYYFSKPDSLVGVNISTGQIVSQVQTNLPATSYFELPHYNCRDSLIYGLYRTPSTLQLATVNPLTGVISIISPVSIDSGIVGSTKGSLDPAAGVYFFQGIQGFHSVSLATGLVLSTVNPVFSGPGNYFVLSLWDCADSLIYGLNRDANANLMYPATMSMQTGAVTNITTQGIPTQGVYMCTAELNSLLNLFHYSDMSGFKTVNTSTGNMIGSAALTFSSVNNTQYFDLIARDNCKCYLPTLTGINEVNEPSEITIQTNPVQRGTDLLVKLNFPAYEANTEVIDLRGRQVMAAVSQNAEQVLAINTSALAPGTYIVRITDEAKRPAYAKFIIY